MNISAINFKFIGFLYTLLALVLLAMFGMDSKFVDVAVGGLVSLITGMGRDLYRSRTADDDVKKSV